MIKMHSSNARDFGAVQGRPLKVSDLIPLGPVPAIAARQGGVSVPADWLPSFPADKATPWKVRRV